MMDTSTLADARKDSFLREYETLERERDLTLSGKIHKTVDFLFPPPDDAQLLLPLILQEKKFPDLSFWQGKPDFDVMRTKTDALIIRGGQGKVVDREFLRNYAESKRVGMARGVYWFYDDRVSPGEQAKAIIDLLKNDKPEMGVWIDWETNFGGQFAGLRNVVALMQAVEAGLPGVKVGIYTGYYWFINNSNPIMNYSQYTYLADKDLWLAWYGNAADVKVPRPWSTHANITHWQFGTPVVGKEFGVESYELDMNCYNGSSEQFDLIYRSTVSVPPTEGDPMPDYVYSITPTGLNGSAVRPEPETGNTKLTISLPYGKFAHGNKKFTIAENKYEVIGGVNTQVNRAGDVWLEVLEVNGTPLSPPAYIAEIHLGVRYAMIKQIGTVPTDPPVEPPPATASPLKISVGGDGYEILSVQQNGNALEIQLRPVP